MPDVTTADQAQIPQLGRDSNSFPGYAHILGVQKELSGPLRQFDVRVLNCFSVI